MKLQLGDITAILGDCMEYMKSLPDKAYDLAIACHNQGFQLSIIEIDEQYFNDAVKRLKWEQRQLQLEFK